MSRREIWEEVYRRFDAKLPAPEAWWVDRRRGPSWAITRQLDRRFADLHPRFSLSGTVGTGKSTELLRLVESRHGRDLVIFLDLHRHFQFTVGDSAALARVQPWEICALVGTAAVAASQSAPRWTGRAVAELEKAWAHLAGDGVDRRPTVDLGKLAASLLLTASPVVDGGLALALKAFGDATRATRWMVPMGVRGRRVGREQDAVVRRLIDAVNDLLAEAAEIADRRVLVVVDGLDRIADLDAAKRVFVQSDLLAQLRCALVVTVPFALGQDLLLSRVPGFTDVPLVNAAVLDHDAPDDAAREGPGVAFMRQLFEARVADLPGADGLIDEAALRRVARYSGGVPRDFVRCVNELAGSAWDDDLDVIDASLVDQVLDGLRRRMETGLRRQHEVILRATMANPRTLPDRDPLVDELLHAGRLLPYPNESVWYYPHPLLLLGRLAPGAGPR